MATTQASRSAAVRARLSHPVIDSDGHTVEFEPAVMDCLRQVGGPGIVERYKTERSTGMAASLGGLLTWHRLTPVTEEAHELVEHGIITAEDFRDFVFTNPTTLWTGMNPDFFKGTVVEQAVSTLLADGAH